MTEEQLRNELLYYTLLEISDELRSQKLLSGMDEKVVRQQLISNLKPTMGSIYSNK